MGEKAIESIQLAKLDLPAIRKSTNVKKRNGTAASLVISGGVHACAFALAAIGSASPWIMETDIARGKAAMLVVSIPSSANWESGDVDLPQNITNFGVQTNDEPTFDHREPADTQARPAIDYAVAAELAIETTLTSVDASRNLQSGSMPEVDDASSTKRGKTRRLSPPAALASVPASMSDQSNGATFDTPPKKLPQNKPPIYPLAAQRAGHQGAVLLMVLIEKDGTVQDVVVQQSSGFTSLDESAMDAVAKWRFSPALSRGLAVSAKVIVPIRFSLVAS
jgi:TonB family protein